MFQNKTAHSWGECTGGPSCSCPLIKFIKNQHNGDEDKLDAFLQNDGYSFSYLKNPDVFKETCLPLIEKLLIP